jgi:CheY-like chemotaxis protein
MVPVRLFLVEDDAALRDLTARGLREYGFHVETAADGAEALLRLGRGERYDVLVVDDRMPRLTGRELLRRLRADGVTTTAIVYSGDLLLAEDECQAHGIDALVRKPARIEELSGAIRRALAVRAAR